ncbi:MAG: hypothetical protein ACYDCO_12980 [Armatimonadota bacterium]
MRTRLPFATFTSTVFIVLASFLPWASFEYDMPFAITGATEGQSATAVATAWNSSLAAFGFITPNWILVALAVLIAVLVFLVALNAWPNARILALWLCCYGIIYSIICNYQLLRVFLETYRYSENRMGAGGLIMLVCFIVMAIQAEFFESSPIARETRVLSE